MAKSYLDFINEQKNIKENELSLNESIKEGDIKKAMDLIDEILKKHIADLIPLVGYVDTKCGKHNCISKQYIIVSKSNPKKSSGFQFNWLKDVDSYNVYSIDFFKNINDLLWKGKSKSDLTIKTLGTSIVTFLPVIWHVIINNDYKLSLKDVKKLQDSVFIKKDIKESSLNINNIQYCLFEGLNEDIIKETYILNSLESISESSNIDPKLKEYKKELKRKRDESYLHRKDNKEAYDLNKKLAEEYEKILNAMRSGATTLEEVKASISYSENVEVIPSKNEKEIEDEITGRKEPDQVFKEMQKYIKLVINGIQPSLIICGAPGVGKTYRVKQQLKAAGYTEGINMLTLKGKCTPRALYTSLYTYKDKKNIILIDDADALVGPHAPEDSINILKAALDSTSDDEGRIVTYGIAGKLTDEEGMDIPKRFYYNGGIIVLTNWRAGQLDTALRGRSYIQDINFTTKEILEVIHKLLPTIEPSLYSGASKLKAYNFLMDLYDKGSDMELSLRTFIICVKLYQAAENDSDLDEDTIKSMIIEQMKLQSASRVNGGGGKY